MSVNELYGVTSHLSGGTPAGGMGAEMERIKGDCGWIINSIDWVIEKFWSPGLREAIIKKLAGDFNAMDSMKQAWGNVALALEEVGKNFDGLHDQLGPRWEGVAADAGLPLLSSCGNTHGDMAEASKLIQDQLGNLIDVSVAAAEVVSMGLQLINDIIQELITDAAVPAVGWAKALFTGAGKVKKAISLINRCLDAIEKIHKVVKIALKFLTYFNVAMGGVNTVLKTFVIGTGVNAGTHVDDTAAAGFT